MLKKQRFYTMYILFLLELYTVMCLVVMRLYMDLFIFFLNLNGFFTFYLSLKSINVLYYVICLIIVIDQNLKID